MVQELCSGVRGVQVSSSTSHDATNPPIAIADGKPNSYWTSTGLFPQEVTIAFPNVSNVKRIEIVSMGIRSMEILRGDVISSSNWEKICSQGVDDADGELQRLSPSIDSETKTGFVRIKITAGWSDFVSIFNVSIIGSASQIGNPHDNKNSTAAYQGSGSLSSRLGASGGEAAYNGSPSNAIHSGRHK